MRTKKFCSLAWSLVSLSSLAMTGWSSFRSQETIFLWWESRLEQWCLNIYLRIEKLGACCMMAKPAFFTQFRTQPLFMTTICNILQENFNLMVCMFMTLIFCWKNLSYKATSFLAQLGGEIVKLTSACQIKRFYLWSLSMNSGWSQVLTVTL